ncbi:MAG: aa3-type cytochrome c oxidase subunit IV [Pseudomonadota bacterium]
MAEIEFQDTDPKNNAMDFPAHKETYETFLGMTKWGIILIVALLAFMAMTLV